MKPIRLRMKAFISYKDEQIIDFTKFTDGLFLIEGDTGAGKTTIFDAISFALYGMASGQSGQSNQGRTLHDLHCNMVPMNENTEVELVFSQGGKEYKVTRTIKYTKRRGTKDEYYNPKQEATLVLPNGEVVRVNRSAKEDEISKIVGLTKEQFEKIVMLAQGEFKEFLEADSDKKEEILKRIIDVSEYEKYSGLLKKSYVELNRSRLDNETAIKNHMESAFEQTYLEEGFSDEMFLCGNPDLLQNLLSLKEEETKALDLMKKAFEEKDREFQNLNNEKTKGEQLNEKISTLEERRNRFSQLMEISESMEALRGKLDKVSVVVNKIQPAVKNLDGRLLAAENNDAEIDHLEKDISSLQEEIEKALVVEEEDKAEIGIIADLRQSAASKRALLGKYDEYNNALEEIRIVGQRINDARESIDGIGDKLKKLNVQEQEGKAEKEGIKDPSSGKAEAEQALGEVTRKQEGLKTLKEKCESIEEKDRSLADIEKELIVLRADLEEKKYNYDIIFIKYIDSQAPLIAESIENKLTEEGEAICPVCGSLITVEGKHRLAKAGEGSVTKEELNSAQRAVDHATESLDGKKTEYNKMASANEKDKEEAVRRAKEIFGDCDGWDDLTKDYLDSKTELLNDESESWSAALKKSKDEEERLAQLEKEIKEIGEKRNALIIEKIEKTSSVDHDEDDLKKLKAKSDNLKESLQFPSKEDALKEIEGMEKDAETRDNAVTQHRESLTNLRNDFAAKDSSLKEKKNLKGQYETEIKTARLELEKVVLDNGFVTAEDALLVLEGIESPEEWIVDNKNQINEYDIEVKSTEARINELEEETEGCVAVDIDAINERIEKTDIERKEMQSRLNDMTSVFNNHVNAYNVVKKNKDKNAGTEEAWQILNRLSTIAGGASTDEGKVTFERFILGAFFAEVLEYANEKLKTLSDGEYWMKFRGTGKRTNAAAGLDVEIVKAGGGIVSKGSISGGEKFLTSLSLALGLSDMAQANAGGQTLDSLFIDEGFGTLDDKSLNLTMQVLMNLTNKGNRLVGIISHVDVSEYPIAHKLHIVKKGKASVVTIK